jgi:hypothetical protein
MSDTLKPDYERLAKEISAEQGEPVTAEYLESLDNRTESEWLNKFGEERNAALASQVSSPSPFFYTHPVVKILNHDRIAANDWTGSLEEELTNQDMLDAEEAL